MGSFSFTYPTWLLLYAGALSSILVANLIQWISHRERIYILYSGYITIWLITFICAYITLPPLVFAFVGTVSLPLFSILYFELAVYLLNLADRPRLLRWIRMLQWGLVVATLPEVYFHFFSSLWQTDWHETQLNISRFIIFVVTSFTIIYTVGTFARSTDKLARFFVSGTIALLVGEVVATSILLHYGPVRVRTLDLPLKPEFIMQIGILIDLACVSLGLAYRQRQQTKRQIMVEQELIREREQRVRQRLEADLTLERLKQEKTEMQMRALQSQVNPHFLFNSLNTLSSLIDENPDQATDYVDELSSVYRYLLRAADNELTTIRVELNFIQSYFHLLKTRFGSSITIDVSVSELQSEAMIPPLTLQLLVENAVKHNIVLPDQPLSIRIYTTNSDELVVENNMQRRMVRVESNGVGLSNIADKYRLLNRPAPRIEEIDGWFRVTLPLLQSVALPVNKLA
jgi:sensor histidine kinase YesM